LQGYCGVRSLSSPTPSEPPLPAANTKTVLAHADDLIASAVACEREGPPKLPLTTLAPFLQAYIIELMIASPGSEPLRRRPGAP
jgi:hypothetical protein